jgi:CIC family chloride channel protein
VTVGLGAGVGAIFRTPLAGALLGSELVYRNGFAVEALLPGLIASVVAFAVFGSLIGFDPIFGSLDGLHSTSAQLVIYPVLGVAAGLLGRLFARTFYATARTAAREWRILPKIARPALGGLLVGGMGLLIPGVLGTSYGTIQGDLSAQHLATASLWIVIAIPFAKIVATSLSIGSGGSGGIFGPSLVMGAGLGAIAWRLLPGSWMPDTPAPIVIACAAACLGSIARAPVAVVVLVAEATRDPWMLIPAGLATAVAYLVVGDDTLYVSQLPGPRDARKAPEPGGAEVVQDVSRRQVVKRIVAPRLDRR